ncbi:DapH/DapD/GlmU-related protein [Luteolibacter marinus]|uniref:DapH/DapD/GlmU-related protein n=1 Tax=Luteolibacter marinus TaxID=2776705 RepID=UPI001D00ED87|nr:DapH/DapD/GlmU-related protein [Luteolibacter marinus]
MSGAAIVARKEIVIGKDVLLGAGCKILDNDFHPIDAEERCRNVEASIRAEAIVIEDKVWIGGGATILKGVRLGEGCVVGASAVVTKSLPAFSVAAGNPAKVIRMLKQRDPQVAADE